MGAEVHYQKGWEKDAAEGKLRGGKSETEKLRGSKNKTEKLRGG